MSPTEERYLKRAASWGANPRSRPGSSNYPKQTTPQKPTKERAAWPLVGRADGVRARTTTFREGPSHAQMGTTRKNCKSMARPATRLPAPAVGATTGTARPSEARRRHRRRAPPTRREGNLHYNSLYKITSATTTEKRNNIQKEVLAGRDSTDKPGLSGPSDYGNKYG